MSGFAKIGASTVYGMYKYPSDIYSTVTIPDVTADLALNDIVIANLPAGAIITRVIGRCFVHYAYCDVDDSSIDAAQLIRIKPNAGTWGVDDTTLINFNTYSISLRTANKFHNLIFEGNYNVVAVVSAAGTYNLQWHNAHANRPIKLRQCMCELDVHWQV